MTTITQVITALPTAPDPATMTRDEFSAAAAASVLAQKAMTPEINTWATQANTVAGEVNTNATNAAASAVAAAASAASSAASAGVTKWISGTAYTEGDNVWSPIDFLTYRRKITGGGTTDPSADSTNWQLLLSSAPAGAYQITYSLYGGL